jgi:restriction system protein
MDLTPLYPAIGTVLFMILWFCGVPFFASLATSAVLAFVLLWLFAMRIDSVNKRAVEEVGRRREQLIRDLFNCNPHYATTLKRIRSRSIYKDEYGDPVFDRWRAELDTFVITKVPIAGLEHNDAVRSVVTAIVLKVLDECQEPPADDTRLMQTTDPKIFEELCAEVFADVGFDVTVNGRSGDQGADVIAALDGYRIVVQCKLYSSPVGNKAVQEVAAARKFYEATVAIVVATQGFTPSARVLAEKLGVVLTQADQLRVVAQAARGCADKDHEGDTDVSEIVTGGSTVGTV